MTGTNNYEFEVKTTLPVLFLNALSSRCSAFQVICKTQSFPGIFPQIKRLLSFRVIYLLTYTCERQYLLLYCNSPHSLENNSNEILKITVRIRFKWYSLKFSKPTKRPDILSYLENILCIYTFLIYLKLYELKRYSIFCTNLSQKN